MTTSLRVFDTPSAWHGSRMAETNEWIHQLTEAEIAELEGALATAKANGMQVPGMAREDFPLPTFGRTLASIREELENGRGFVLIRGLPMERYGDADTSLIYWGIGRHLGTPVPQNADGHLLGHVRDLGFPSPTADNVRGYQTTMHLPFHNDSADVVGLLCLRPSRSGGLSCIVSSVAIHNRMVQERPDLAEALYQEYCVDRRGEQAPGEKPYYTTQVFNLHRGRLFVRYNRSYIMTAQRFPGVPKLTEKQIEALDMVDRLAASDELRLDIDFRPGDMQFLANHTVLHSRTEYEDFEAPEQKRHLLRLWLNTPGFRDRPPSFKERYDDIKYWGLHPRSSIPTAVLREPQAA